MSWFYEALQRAEKERRKSGNGTRTKTPGRDRESLLAPIQSLPSVAAETSQPEPDGPTSEALAPVEPSSRLVLSRQEVRGEADKPSNGFRHLTLPVSVWKDSRLVFRIDPHGLAAERFRLLRRTLKQEFPTGAVLLITSPGEGDGKTLTSLNLSVCLGSSGDTALLVEADLRRPTVGTILGGSIQPPGIEDAWMEKNKPRETVHLIDELSLYAAVVTKPPENPSRLVNAPGARQFIQWARENFRWVVIDAPPVLPAADVAELLPLADAALLIVRAQSTPKELTRRAFEMLGKRLHGVILNAAMADSDPYYGYLGARQYGGEIKKANPVPSATGENRK